jgi:hypothetical protein
MRVAPLVLSFILSLFLSFPSLAQQATAPAATQDPQAVGVLQSAFAALGGQTAPAPATLVATGTYTRQPGNLNQVLPIQIEALGTGSIRWDTSDVNGTVTLVVSRASSWMQGPDGARALAVGETFGRGGEIFPLLLFSRWLGTAGVGMTWVAAEPSSGKVLNHVTVVPPTQTGTGPRMANCEVWADAQTNLPTRIRVSHSPTDRRVSIPLDLDFSDYRMVNGILFPFSITFSVGTHVMGQIQFQTITVNAPVSASDFIASNL